MINIDFRVTKIKLPWICDISTYIRYWIPSDVLFCFFNITTVHPSEEGRLIWRQHAINLIRNVLLNPIVIGERFNIVYFISEGQKSIFQWCRFNGIDLCLFQKEIERLSYQNITRKISNYKILK